MRQKSNGPVRQPLTQHIGARHDEQRPVAGVHNFKRIRQGHEQCGVGIGHGYYHEFFLAFSAS